MLRRLPLAVSCCLSLATVAWATGDAGVSDAGPTGPGAPAPRDGGTGRTDGGVDAGARDAGVDAGPPPTPKRARWSWEHGDGGFLLDGGVTDILSVTVGETAEVRFPHPILLMQCDEVLVSLSATEDTLLLKGEKPGHTQCGFWWFRQAWPNRMMDVTVKPAP